MQSCNRRGVVGRACGFGCGTVAKQLNSGFAFCSDSALAFWIATFILMQKIVGSILRNRIFSLVTVAGFWVVRVASVG